MLTVIYDTDVGVVRSDSKCRSFVDEVLAQHLSVPNQLTDVSVANEMIINEFRLAIRHGRIGTREIQFKFQDKVIPHHANGKMVYWPSGFCDTYQNQLTHFVR